MLNYSFSTVLMALMASNLAIGLIALIFLKEEVMPCVGYQLLALAAGTAIFRLLFPVELPFCSSILLPERSSKLIATIRCPQIQILGLTLSPWNLFEIVWYAGIVVKLIHYFRNRLQVKRHILIYGTDLTNCGNYKETLDQICHRYKRDNSFRIIELPELDMPFLYGGNSPCIILPAEMDISPKQLYYVLCHEALHYFHYHPLIKGAVHILSILYWWNPACILLRNEVDVLLEMHVDRLITGKSGETIKEYAECLLYIKKNALEKSVSTPDCLKTSYPLRFHSSAFKKRMLVLLQNPPHWKKIFTGGVTAIFLMGIYMLSYLFIFEANYRSPKVDQETSLAFTEENTYLIQIDSSNYEVYFNEKLIEITDHPELYPKGIKIYNQKRRTK